MNNNQLVALFSVPFVNCCEDYAPAHHRFAFSHLEQLAVIFDNTLEGVQQANAVLFSYLLNYILPEENSTLAEFNEAGLVVLDQFPSQPINDSAVLAKLFRDYGFKLHNFQSMPKVIAHGLPNSIDFCYYNDEFCSQLRCVGFNWDLQPVSISNDLVLIDRLRNTKAYDKELNLRNEQILDAVSAVHYHFSNEVVAQPIIVKESEMGDDEYNGTQGLTINAFAPLTVQTIL